MVTFFNYHNCDLDKEDNPNKRRAGYIGLPGLKQERSNLIGMFISHVNNG